MSSQDWLPRLLGVRVWRRGAERAPHKPLLLLFLFGRVRQTGSSAVTFAECEPAVDRLLAEFGPPRSTSSAYPFFHLQSDGFWTVSTLDGSPPGNSAGSLHRGGAHGRLDPDLEAALLNDPVLLLLAARALLDDGWPSTMHEDIALATGIDLEAMESTAARSRTIALVEQRRARDRQFREQVLIAYEMRCAFCEFDGRLDSRAVGLDAAHVMWWSHGGPDTTDNGLCLCSSHHKLLDLGVLGLSSERTIDVSGHFIGRGRAAADLVLDLHGRTVLAPRVGTPEVAEPHILWHREQVFREPARAAR